MKKTRTNSELLPVKFDIKIMYVSSIIIALWIDDFSIASPAMLIGGLFLWKKKPLGYVVAPGLFIVYSVLSLGLIPFLVIQSHLQNRPVELVAILILVGMALICLIPFSFFVRAVKRKPVLI